jgi:myo-inositol-1(or 4)-monophosphatase
LKELVLQLARALRAHVLPQLGLHSGRSQARAGSGGDVTFAIDEEAEKFLERFLAEHSPGVSFFSEDRGLVQPDGRSDWVLVVDPIDGTRPALAGLESCCVSVAAARLAGDSPPTMGDVGIGCIVEIKTGATFAAERGFGIEWHDSNGKQSKPRLSANGDLGTLFWSTGFRGRPAAPLIAVLGDLIDTSSVGGAFFDLGSATFDMTRIVTGQLDAYLDVGSLMIERLPELRAEFEAVGDGAVLNNSPYDLAAAVLCLEEAGAVVTDARGEPLDGRPLLGSGHEFQMSCLAAANARLHSRLLGVVEHGIEDLLGRSS